MPSDLTFFQFLFFFIPGFISIKVYDLLMPGLPRDFSQAIYEAIAYSSLNFAAMSWMIWPLVTGNVLMVNPARGAVELMVILMIMPVIWPLLIIHLSRLPWVARYIVTLKRRPWDEVFSDRQHYWVIVHLKDGRKIGGKYGDNSYASVFPENEQIYLEELWQIDDHGAFDRKVERSQGMIILNTEIVAVEFFEP
ncbi:DUF6338 family protein [Heliophilum fasciatum]|uniref:Uncharacterized protein n=1 Tax=Heliophilum fasciatum TaxID=35700 RepID=A0A4R2RG04_9FIRM|nr:DUF6338 family protein [Heliophilum fasciatum]MCW2278689.1 hypothetical protein [Heliophilum fasciatum]TCP62590.1 hypothetical protein EDD73_1207 [Heliophilum fasciatum]